MPKILESGGTIDFKNVISDQLVLAPVGSLGQLLSTPEVGETASGETVYSLYSMCQVFRDEYYGTSTINVGPENLVLDLICYHP